MKKFLPLFLVLSLLVACFVIPALAVDDPPFSAKVVGTVDTVNKYNGRDTMILDWQLTANRAGMVLNNTQGLRLTYDNTVLQLVSWDRANDYDSMLGTAKLIDMPGAGTDGYYDADKWNVYGARNVAGDIGYLSLAVGNEGAFTTWPLSTYNSLLRIRFAFREGKSEANLNPGSICIMTLEDLITTDQKYAMLINTTEGTGTSYEYLAQEGGILLGNDTLNSPIFQYPGSSILYGDVNDDGSVDPLDVAILSRYVANWPGYVVNRLAADVNIDDSIDPLDAAILARHVANWPGYLTLPYRMSMTDQPQMAAKQHASDEPTISVGNATGKAGDTVVIPISLLNNPGITVMRLSVAFNNEALRLVKVEDQSKLNGAMHPPVSNSPYTLSWSDPFATANNTFSGEVINLHFEILEDAAPTESSITVTYGSNDILNKDLGRVSFEVANGKVTIETSAAPKIKVGSATGEVGDTVVIPFNLENNPGITVMRLSVAFDSKTLRLVKVEDQGKIGGPMHPPVSDSPYTLSWSDPFATVDNTFSGKTVDLYFEILEGAVPGVYSITATYGQNDILNKDLGRVPFEVENGFVEVFGPSTFTITASAGANGSITPSGSVTVLHGDSQSFAFTPAGGYEVDTVTVDGAVVAAATGYTFENVTTNHTINVTFKRIAYTITASAGANGSITPSGSVTVLHGDSQSFAFT
ncbi:MAG: dockerin type I domain-containing protein, partial [Clostridiales bacterium]|nr:dockerin type I domain-containing protein [Clostridiales bacterium]